jgi:uncharacterized protein YkwD
MLSTVRAARGVWLAGLAVLLLACDGDSGTSTGTSAAQLSAQEAEGPRASGDVASDGLRWINFRRAQAGLAITMRDARIDRAAASHASYQQLNNQITHDETPEKTAYTGADAPARLRAAGYPLTAESIADGEVIAATAEPDGFAAAEGLMGAIYHRYLMLEPRFDLAGSGSAHRAGGYYWLNVNFVATRNSQPLGAGRVIVWPAPDQKNVRSAFLSDEETPDPVAGKNEVGFPVSVHADSGTSLRVSQFTLREQGGAVLPVKLLEHRSDGDTPASAAAIIPLTILRKATIYEAEFVGTTNDIAVARRWSFTTQ